MKFYKEYVSDTYLQFVDCRQTIDPNADAYDLMHDYCSLDPKEKLNFLLCIKNPELGAELFDMTYDETCSSDGEEVLAEDSNQKLQTILEKVAETKCDPACQAQTNESLATLTTAESNANGVFNALKITKTKLEEFNNNVENYVNLKTDKRSVQNQLDKRVDIIFGNLVANNETKATAVKRVKELKAKISKELESPGANYENVLSPLKQEINFVKQQTVVANKNKDIIKRAGNKIRKNFKMISNPQKLQKATAAIGAVASAIPKFQSGNVLNIISGTLDIATAILEFLPPPASIIAGTFKGHMLR